MAHHLLTMSATRMAELIRRREITSTEAVVTHIEAIERRNPAINAVVANRFEQALAEARKADDEVTKTPPAELPVFHGVPCTIKESFSVEGMPNSGGLLARRKVVAESDGLTVRRLRATGVIPLGVTNLSELCMWMESHNTVYGRTGNPYDPARIPGGSSGGEAAIVGAGASPLGLGSDIGGSIRMPAFFCGVFGHKPTGGLVPNAGQFPCAEGEAQRYMTTGPICRRAEDLFPFLTALAGPDGSPFVRPFELGDPDDVDLTGLRVVHIADNGLIPVSRELRRAQRRCMAHLQSEGAEVVTPIVPRLRRSLEIWSAMLSAAGGTSFSELMGEGTAIDPLRQLGRWLRGRSPHTLPAIGLAALERLPALQGPAAERLVAMGSELQREIEQLIGPRGVMLYPPYPTVAPRHHVPLLPPVLWAYTSIINVLELPSTQVPLGLNGRGLPLGVQVIGCRGSDHLTIGVARQLERAFGGWIAPAGA